jgi:hypothetical protein
LSNETRLIVAADLLEDGSKARCARFNCEVVDAVYSATGCIDAAQRMKDARAGGEGEEAAYCDPFALMPEYGRPPEAERLWRAHHGNGGRQR